MAGNLFVVDALEIKWGKLLMQMPFLTIKEIEAHRQNSGKDHGGPILKTLERGRKCMEERYISADSVYTIVQDDHFLVKGSCKASMKKELRTIRLNLNINTGYVNNAMCSCPAGLSGYCNHVMALLLELAVYSLNQLQNVPEELACTSKLRQWGVPGQSSNTKDPTMSCIIQKKYDKKEISCTLYNPRINDSRENVFARFTELENKLRDEDLRIGYAHCRDPSLVATKTIKQ